MALAHIDQGEIEEAKQYIVGAIKIFDDECKILEEGKTMVGQGDILDKKPRSRTKKRLKKS